jgi:hypothetical protein
LLCLSFYVSPLSLLYLSHLYLLFYSPLCLSSISISSFPILS